MVKYDRDFLTNREKNVIDLIGQGLSGRTIAAKLGITYFTLRKHRLAILRKFGLNKSAELVSVAAAMNRDLPPPELDLLCIGVH